MILNVGSFTGLIPTPLLATYSGSKSFMSTFTTALAEEVKRHNIVVQYLNTYYVVSLFLNCRGFGCINIIVVLLHQVTKMSRIRGSSFMVPTPAAYVRATLSKIGLACGAAMTNSPNTLTPYWAHALLDYFIYMVGWKAAFISERHTTLNKVRRRALLRRAIRMSRAGDLGSSALALWMGGHEKLGLDGNRDKSMQTT